MSRALQLKSIVNFKMLLHPMQCDSTDEESNARANKKNLRARGSVSVLGKILASVKPMAILLLPSAELGFYPLPLEKSMDTQYYEYPLHWGLFCKSLGFNF